MKKIIAFLFGISIVTSCTTSNDSNGNSNAIALPTLTTTAIPSIVTTTAISGGTILSDGGAAITAKGVCWGTSVNPTIALPTKTNDGAGTSTFTSTIASLFNNTIYYVRAYATNSLGTSYGNQVSFTSLQNSTAINVPGPNITDIDGNVYSSVTNCNQTWSQRNLNVSKYSDGTPIPQVTDQTVWANLTTGAWCYYSNDPTKEAIYGKLYNWYAVAGINDAAAATNPALRKKLAPTGWHIPTDAEFNQLTACLGGMGVAGGKMKATGTIQAGTGLWNSPNTNATNASGFTGLPGGFRYNNGFSSGLGNWWSSSESLTSSAWYLELLYNYGSANRGGFNKIYGLSVRCIKD